jgi:hypothetical protein
MPSITSMGTEVFTTPLTAVAREKEKEEAQMER